MVKPDFTRNYYADLELVIGADVVDVKKQFKKLALKHHPDRNPGGEDAAKDKFIVIQTAHEILTDAAVKAKYDAYLKRNNPYPAASGFKGNPYQNVSADMQSKFGAPPTRRTPGKTNPPTPYSTWGVPTHPKPKPTNHPDNATAWDRMRSSSTRGGHFTSGAAPTRPVPPQPQTKTTPQPPPPPPRTAAQARRAEAAFGTKKTGFAPTSQMGDEPPVKNQHYNTNNLHSNLFEETAANVKKSRPGSSFIDPLADQLGDTFLDSRQRTPYASHHVGEKTNPFEGASVNRAKSVRESWQRYQESDDEATPPKPNRQRSASVGEDGLKNTAKENNPFPGFTPTPASRFTSQASARYSPRPADPKNPPPTASFAVPPNNPTAANNFGNGGTPNKSGPNVFTVPDDEDDGPISPSQEARFMRNSTDNINTRFVAEERAGANYQFSAGAASSTNADDLFLRAKQRSRSSPRGRQPTLNPGFGSSSESFTDTTQQNNATQKQSAFVPDEWVEKIKAHNFVPPPINRQSSSPTRSTRPAKKVKPVRMTAGTAGLVVDDEETTSGEDRFEPGLTPTEADINGAPSPIPMDIDTPPPEQSAAQQANGARNIPVEPSKPEWRAGDLNGAGNKPAETVSAVPRPGLNTAGSEDTDAFSRGPLFGEFQKVEPFMPKSTGLGSLEDLVAGLPFESKASARLPLEKEQLPKTTPVDFPHPPVAPQTPPALAIAGLKPSEASWKTYVRDFQRYLVGWAAFEKRISDHFAARQRAGEATGDDRFAWTNTRSDTGIQTYLRNLEQDNFVRQRWAAACEAHKLRVREFGKHRDRMKQ